jgi:prepilin-type processing-associated H-X9-DG protein
VVIGIIAVLIAILLPAMMGARAQARAVKCESNVRQIVLACTMYASANHGRYPPNQFGNAPGRLWYDYERCGEYLTSSNLATGEVSGGAAVCPEDPDAQRSYAMNVWASSAVDPTVSKTAGVRGSMWSSNVPYGSQMILVAECWAIIGSQSTGWLTSEPFGWIGTTPGSRFGGAGGIVPISIPSIGAQANSELPYQRHRNRHGPGVGTEPRGRVSIGYADGHVEMKSDTDLVDPVSGKSTLDSLWSPLDPSINF